MNARFVFILVISLIFGKLANAQDPIFSQFYSNPLYLNPAFAGSEMCPRVALNYRNQWPQQGSDFVTYSASYDQHISWLEGGLGLHVMADRMGAHFITSKTVSLMYAYTFKVNRTFFIKGGFQTSFVNNNLDTKQIYPDMIHPLYGVIKNTEEDFSNFESNRNYFDFSLGLLGYTKMHYFGFAVHHLTEPSESFRGAESALPMKFTAHYGAVIPVRWFGARKGELSISPNIIYQKQAQSNQLNYGFYFNRSSIVGGFWARHDLGFKYDAFIMMLGYNNGPLRLAYSFDFTLSKLSGSTNGSHEISVGYIFPCPEKKRKYSIIKCPSF